MLSQDQFASRVPGNDDDDWGSDFEGELCSQEIEDNKINEIREANLQKNSPINVHSPTENNSQTENHSFNATKTGAIPKTGFSYLTNIVNTDSNRSFQNTGKESRTNVRPQSQVSQEASQSSNASRNSVNSERQSHTNITSNNDTETKMTPRKLKPEAFSFLNKLPQKKAAENGSDASKERKTLIPTAFSHAEKLAVSQSLDDSITTVNESSDVSNNTMPSAPSLENMSSNYESVTEEPFSELALPPANSIMGKENVPLPPLPTRPPPVFKYPPETFSKSTSVESTCNQAISQPVPAYPKLAHSVSSPDSGLKQANVTTEDRILSSKMKNRKSLPPTSVYPTVPNRPLPPLPISEPGNVSSIKSPAGTKLVSPDSVNAEKWLEEAPIIHGMIPSHQTNQLPTCEAPVQHTAVKELVIQEQLVSSPQHRLAQILTNQTSVNNAVLLSQKKIASAITSRAFGSQSSSASRVQNTEESEFQTGGRPHESTRMNPGRSFENAVEGTSEDQTEQQPSYLEAKDATNPRRFTDHETLINAMNRPILPQKAPPMQRSVSCNSLVQSIKDLSFSVWSKPENKRKSDGVSVSKKNIRSISAASSSKVKCSAPISITLMPTEAPSEVTNTHLVKTEAPPLGEKSTLQEFPWFHDVDAKEGQLRLQSVGQEGTFLIRPSSRPTEDIQNTLCIFYNGKVRNLHIRRMADGRYMLGTKSNKAFSSLTEMIRHHREIPVEILPHGSTQIKPQLYRILLRETPPKQKKLFAVV